MKQFDNEYGGLTVTLDSRDKLGDLPSCMRSLVTSRVEQAFAEPRKFFEGIARRTTLKNFAEYLELMIANNHWRLVVEEAYVCSRVTQRVTRVGFYWYHPNSYPTTIAIRPASYSNLIFAQMSDLAHGIYWAPLPFSGGILSEEEFHPLDGYCLDQDAFPNGAEAVIFAEETNGDIFVYDLEGQAGMLSHETGDAMGFASIHECCEWIFEQLLAGAPPEFQWNGPRCKIKDSVQPFPPRIVRPDD